jgi:hypothetical protein
LCFIGRQRRRNPVKYTVTGLDLEAGVLLKSMYLLQDPVTVHQALGHACHMIRVKEGGFIRFGSKHTCSFTNRAFYHSQMERVFFKGLLSELKERFLCDGTIKGTINLYFVISCAFALCIHLKSSIGKCQNPTF